MLMHHCEMTFIPEKCTNQWVQSRVADAIVEGVSISLLQALKYVAVKMLACDMIIKYELLMGDIPVDPATPSSDWTV